MGRKGPGGPTLPCGVQAGNFGEPQLALAGCSNAGAGAGVYDRHPFALLRGCRAALSGI